MPSSTGSNQGPTSSETAPALIAHADRLWKAEEANAARLQTRVNIVWTGLTAVMGFGAAILGPRLSGMLNGGVFGWLALACLVGGAACLVKAMLHVLGTRRRADAASPAASGGLILLNELRRRPWAFARHEVEWYLFRTTYDAAKALQKRNADRQATVDKSQFWFLFGFFGTLASILLVSLSVWSRGIVERSHDPSATTADATTNPDGFVDRP